MRFAYFKYIYFIVQMGLESPENNSNSYFIVHSKTLKIHQKISHTPRYYKVENLTNILTLIYCILVERNVIINALVHKVHSISDLHVSCAEDLEMTA